MVLHVTLREGEGGREYRLCSILWLHILSYSLLPAHIARGGRRRTTLERLPPSVSPSLPGPRGRVETPSAVLHSAGGRTAPPSVSPSLYVMGRDSAAKRERKSRSDIEIVFASDSGGEVGIHEVEGDRRGERVGGLDSAVFPAQASVLPRRENHQLRAEADLGHEG